MSEQLVNNALTPAKLLAVNVNGLAGESKRKAFLRFVMDAAWDVLVLSETHCGDLAVARKWLKEGAGPGKPWLGLDFWAHGTSASRGVAVLLRHGFAPKAKLVYEDTTAGRLLRVEWQRGPGQRPVAVLAVYAPSDGEASRSVFFANGGPLHSALLAGAGASADTFVGGDFNCKLPVAGPGASSPAAGGLSGDVQRLQSLMAAAGLADVWATTRAGDAQQQCPEDEWTYIARSSGHTRGARLDYWFAPQDLVTTGWVAHCAHRWDAAAPSDHAAVDLHWRCPAATPRGTWRWRFPDVLLKDAAFVPAALEGLKLFLQQWQPAAPEEQAAPARSKWDAAKRWLKQRAVRHMQARAQQRRRDVKSAAAAERSVRASAVQAAPDEAQAAFQRWREAAQRLSAVSGNPGDSPASLDVLWETYGEQSTKWFYQLLPKEPGDPALAGGITAVSSPGPGGQAVRHSVHDVGGVAAVGDALSAFFDGNAGGLFAPGQVSVADQNLLLSAVDRTVPAEEAQHCLGPSGDGTVSAADLKEALGGSACSKAPGSDGLTYEVYHAFWGALGEPLAACFNEALADPSPDSCLSVSQRQGVIALLHKGGDKPADAVASYRPITLLNSDVKLLARLLVGRMAPALECVIDHTQTAFLPGRWIGDNVLFHLEEVDYCQAEGVPGSVLFLDFEKAFDRLDRGWLFRCVDRLGFPAEIGRWVRLLLQGSMAGVLYHGFLSPWVSVLSGVAQGSPLSSVLYLIGAQPLAARLRSLQAAGLVDAVTLPDGSAAPPSFQHADDTTLHARTPTGLRAALDLAVLPFGRASNARLNVDKSSGLLVGADDSEAARLVAEAITGVPFVAPDRHLRHLGLLLSVGDPEGARKAMFAKRRAGVQFRVRSWARFDLSYLGRLHVAKQVLASSLYYHAMFVPPPSDVLGQVVECVDQFVGFGRLVEPGESGGVLRGCPSAAVESLPYELGGLRRADIPAQVMALHGKVAAMLLHPQRQPWKVLMRRAFERLHPALGPAVLVSRLLPVSGSGRSGRLLAYWRAFQALAPCRLVEPGRLSARHVLVERLVRNAQVVGAVPDRATIDALGCLPAALRSELGSLPTLGGLRRVLLGSPGVAQAQALAGQVVPAAWRALVAAPALPDALWLVSVCGGWLRCSDAARNPPGVFAVRSDGRVAPAGGGLPPAVAALGGADGWRPACVVWCPVLKGQELLVSLRPDPHLEGVAAFPVDEGTQLCPLQPWVLGEWGPGVWVDPNVWGLGLAPASAYVVSGAADRLKLLGMCRKHDGFQPAEGVRPRLFAVPGQPGSGLAGMVDSQERLFGERWCALVEGRPGAGRRVRPRLPTDERGLCPLYEAAWMRESVSRALPRERALARQGAELGGGGQARVDDCRDALLACAEDRAKAWPASDGKPPWQQVFADLRRLKRLDRRLRFFGWTLAHGALRCGGALVEWGASGGQTPADSPDSFVELCGCGAEGCVRGQRPEGQPPPCETLSHVFVRCPVVWPAVQWLRRLCQRALGRVPPEHCIVDVIVVGAERMWRPPGDGAHPWGLWSHLRLQFCMAVWSLTKRRARTGHQFDAAAIVAVVAAALERAIRRDWQRCWVAGAGVEAMPSWCNLGLQRVKLDLDEFEGRWLLGGVLAHLEAGGGSGALRVHVPRALEAPVSGA